MINSVVLRRVVIKVVVGFEELSSYIKAEQNVRIVCRVTKHRKARYREGSGNTNAEGNSVG